MQGAWVWSLIGELRSLMPCGLAKKRNIKMGPALEGVWHEVQETRCPWEGGEGHSHDKGRRVFCYPYNKNICNRTEQNFQKQLFHIGALPGRGGWGSSSACILWGWRAQLSEARMPGFQLNLSLTILIAKLMNSILFFAKWNNNGPPHRVEVRIKFIHVEGLK